MIVLSGADLVLPDRVLSPGTLVIHEERIVEISAGARPSGAASGQVTLHGHYVVPGFIDLHVHGLGGHDTLDGVAAIAAMARLMPTCGVVAFAPTSIACAPGTLRSFLQSVREHRLRPAPQAARVLPAHLESNFINPAYRGAQPIECLRQPPANGPRATRPASEEFTGDDILEEIARAEPDIGIVTLAPELAGALDLVRRLRSRGHRVSLGHSAATLDQAVAAIEAGATHATHLFNRMPPIHHRAPGLAGAVLAAETVTAELICDGLHVHPSMLKFAVAAKAPDQILAITDGTAGAGLPASARARLGGRPILMRDGAAYLEDGTLAGSVLTMDGAFRTLTGPVGLSLVDAARLCATSPARAMNLQGRGVLAVGAVADLVVLDHALRVVQTYIDGVCVYRGPNAPEAFDRSS